MNIQNRATFDVNTLSRETRNDFPAPYQKRAKANEQAWRDHMDAERRHIRADTEALNRF